jgi:hypothetical protein
VVVVVLETQLEVLVAPVTHLAHLHLKEITVVVVQVIAHLLMELAVVAVGLAQLEQTQQLL